MKKLQSCIAICSQMQLSCGHVNVYTAVQCHVCICNEFTVTVLSTHATVYICTRSFSHFNVHTAVCIYTMSSQFQYTFVHSDHILREHSLWCTLYIFKGTCACACVFWAKTTGQPKKEFSSCVYIRACTL